MHTILKITLVYAVFAAGAMTKAGAADVTHAQQKFPTKPIRLVVPSSPGTATDTLARLMGQKMSASWGQPVIVDNRSGAGGVIAASVVAKSAADGHVLLLSPGFAITAVQQPNLPYDPLKDFAGVTQLAIGTSVLIVAPSLDVRSFKELIALAKAQPGKVIYGSTAPGSGSHLSGVRILRLAGFNVISVAFKGSPEAVIEVVAGRTHFSYVPLTVALPYIKDGKLLALAITQRSSVLPEVPPLADTLPEFKRSETSTGLLAPAKTPHPILVQIGKEAARVLAHSEMVEWMQAAGFVAAPTTPAEYDRILREQIASISKTARDLGLKMK